MTVSLWDIPSTKFAVSYYGEGNYNSERPDQFERSQWQGKGAELLGLTGRVDIGSLTRVLKGETFDGRCIGQQKGQSFESAQRRKRRPGVDITFSPPKDVSLLYYLGSDERIRIAHETAVSRTIDWVERKKSISHTSQYRNTGWDENKKIVVAKFNHDISREKDPHIHTHALVVNMIKELEGWFSLSNYYMYKDLSTIDFAYNGYLKRYMNDLGYQLTTDPKKRNSWYISGVSQHAIDAFSSRSTQIAESLAGQAFTNSKVYAQVERETRQEKFETPIKDLRLDWEERGKAWLSELKDLCDMAKRRTTEQLVDPMLNEKVPTAEEYVSRHSRFAKDYFKATENTTTEDRDPYTLRHPCSQKDYAARAAVSYGLRSQEEFGKTIVVQAIRKQACRVAALGITIDDIDNEMNKLIEENKDTFKYDAYRQTLITPNLTPDEQRFEHLLALRTSNLLPPTLVRRNKSYTNLKLSPDQENAIHSVLASKNLLIGVEGYPGSGEISDAERTSKFPKDLINALDDKKQPVIGLMTCRSVDDELAKQPNFSQFESHSNKKFAKTAQQDALQNPIILLDVTNLRASTLLHRRLERCVSLNPKRIVLLDNLNISKLPTTKMHAYTIIQNAGIERAIVKDIDNIIQTCKQANTSINRMRSAIRRIGASLTEKKNSGEVINEIFKHLNLNHLQNLKSTATKGNSAQLDKNSTAEQLNPPNCSPIQNSVSSQSDLQSCIIPSDDNGQEKAVEKSNQSRLHQIEDDCDRQDQNNNERNSVSRNTDHKNQEQDIPTQNNSDTDPHSVGLESLRTYSLPSPSSLSSSTSATSLTSSLKVDKAKQDHIETKSFSDIFSTSSRKPQNQRSQTDRNVSLFQWPNNRVTILIPNPELRKHYNQLIRQRLIDCGVLGEVATGPKDSTHEGVPQVNHPTQRQVNQEPCNEEDSLAGQSDRENLALAPTVSAVLAHPPQVSVSEKWQDPRETADSDHSVPKSTSTLSELVQNGVTSNSMGAVQRASNAIDSNSRGNSVDKGVLRSEDDDTLFKTEDDNSSIELLTSRVDAPNSTMDAVNDDYSELAISNTTMSPTSVGNTDSDLHSSAKEHVLESSSEAGSLEKTVRLDTPASATLAEDSKSLLSSDQFVIRLNEELLLTNIDSNDSATDDTAYTSATVVDFDNQTITLDLGDSHQVVQHDDQLLKNAEYGYASPPLGADVSKSETLITLLSSDDGITSDTFNVMVNAAENIDNMVTLVDSREDIAKSLEAHCSIEVPLPNLDTSWMMKYETEAKLESEENFQSQHSLDQDKADLPAAEALQTGNTLAENSLDFEMELSR